MFRILEVQFLPPHLLLFPFLIFKYMLIARSNVNIVDNTGVKQVYLILDSGKTAKVGDVVTCAVKRVRATSTKFPKGSVAYVLITSTNFGSTYKDGLSVRSVGANNGVLVSKLNDPLGSRISTPFSRQSFRRKGFSKVLSIAPFSLLFYIYINGSFFS
jgi:ribosomal protein L14